MAAPKSSIGKRPQKVRSPAAQRTVKAVLLIAGTVFFVGVFWGLIFSVLRDGLTTGGRFIAPQDLRSIAERGSPKERKKLWLALGITLLIPVGFGLASLVKTRKQYGDARFGNEADVRKAGLRSPWGVVLGNFRNLPMMATPPGNVLGFAPPGGGKGVGWVIPTLLQFQGSIVALDPKKENWELTAGFRSKYSAPGDVVLFDPLNYDGRGWRYNPLAQIGDGIQRIDEVDRIANMLIPNPLSGDTYWASGARDLLKGAVLAFAELNDTYQAEIAKAAAEGKSTAELERPEPVALGSVYRLVVNSGVCGERCEALASRVNGDAAKRLLGSFAALPMKQAEGVLGALKDKIGLWGNPAIDAATAASDFTFEGLRRRRQSIYLGVTPDNIERLSPLLGLMFQQAIDALVRRLPTSDETVHVLLLIDEAAMLKRLPVLAASMAFLRGYMGSVFLILQSPAQGVEHYGQAGWRAMVETCKYRVLYAPNSLETATEISKELGTYTMRSVSKSRSAKGGSTSISSAKRELMLPQEVLQMGREKLVLFIEGLRPILGQKVRFFENPTLLNRSKVKPPELPTYAIHEHSGVKLDVVLSASAAGEIETALVEQAADEGVLEVAIAALGAAARHGNSDRVAELQTIARDVAARLPADRPDNSAMIATLMAVGARQ